MSRLYFYKMTHDDGGAPHVCNNLLSLALCKRLIRRTADERDIVFGFAANSLHSDNRLIYVAEITKRIGGGGYYQDPLYQERGDCIYEYEGTTVRWRDGAIYHSPSFIENDLGKAPDYDSAIVLLSNDYRYFGGLGNDEYKTYQSIKCAVEALRQGHRIHHSDELIQSLSELKAEIWRSTSHNLSNEPTHNADPKHDHGCDGCCVVLACDGRPASTTSCGDDGFEASCGVSPRPSTS